MQSEHHIAVYQGKRIAVTLDNPPAGKRARWRAEFVAAANRIADNLRPGEVGHVLTPDRQAFKIAWGNRRAVPVDYDSVPGGVDFRDRPCAAAPWTSYRCRIPGGYIMIGATDSADAMREAKRSYDRATAEGLEVWDGGKYVSVASDKSEIST